MRFVGLTIETASPVACAEFWANLLDRKIVEYHGAPLLSGSATQVGLRFEPESVPRAGSGRVHLHVCSAPTGSQPQVVDRAIGLGAAHLDVGQLPEEKHIVLADPDGNEFCVIEPENGFLAGTGVLGELACDGTRAVGQFWSAAFGWPLVWDQDEETAIQSPAGGTKIAWGGPPLEPRNGRDRQRFEFAVSAGQLASEVDRLTGLGATISAVDPDQAVLHDPDGNEFRIAVD